MACAVRANLEQLARVSGRGAERVHLAGGLSRSALFARILAGVTGCRGRCAAAPEATGLGAALCAGVGAGVYRRDARGRAPGRARGGAGVEPVAGEAAAYEQLYQGWSELRAAGEQSDRSDRDAPHGAGGARGRRSARGRARRAHRPNALVTAAFDDASIAKLRSFADVEYASFRDRMQLLDRPEPRQGARKPRRADHRGGRRRREGARAAADICASAACRGDAVNVGRRRVQRVRHPGAVRARPQRRRGRRSHRRVPAQPRAAAARGHAVPRRSRASPAGNLAAMGKAFRGLQGLRAVVEDGRPGRARLGRARGGAASAGLRRRDCSSPIRSSPQTRRCSRAREQGRARRAPARERLREPARGGHRCDARPDRREGARRR